MLEGSSEVSEERLHASNEMMTEGGGKEREREGREGGRKGGRERGRARQQ